MASSGIEQQPQTSATSGETPTTIKNIQQLESPTACTHHHHSASDSSMLQHLSAAPTQGVTVGHASPHHAHEVASEADLLHHQDQETHCCHIHPAWQDITEAVHTQMEILSPRHHCDAVHKWQSAERKIAKIATGSSHAKHDPLYLQTLHWLEATDPKHRNGSNLKPYFTYWKELSTTNSDDMNFFHWLDFGDGSAVDLEKCPRKKLESQLVHYCNAYERQFYLVEITQGVLRYRYPHPNRQLLSSSTTTQPATEETGSDESTERGEVIDSETLGNGLIYVMDTDERLYINKKVRGTFHHSSFLSGGAAIAAGAIKVVNGTIIQISPQSGHYRPSNEDFLRFKKILTDRGVNLENVIFAKVEVDEG